MAEFGTLDFAVSFSPTTAFPLDSRYYFESLEEANNAASKAVPAGSSDGKYFFGENVVVVADGKATMYIIQPDKTLSEVGEGSSEQQDYTALSNKPSIGGVELNGDMTLDDLGIKQTYTASDISFSDGQTFQQKYDSGDLDGDDGFSPTVQVTTTEDSHTVVITDKAGPHEFLIKNGTNGLDGDDGFSPIVSIEEIPGGHRVGVQDSSGTETFDVMNGQDGAAGDSGVFYGDTEPEDPNVMVWIDPTGGSSPGVPGSGVYIEDNVINKGTTWSSRMIVDSLAPSFEESGPIVTCNPVSGYPLSVTSQISSLQDGEGEATPDNIRPIIGWDASNLYFRGVNLFDKTDVKLNTSFTWSATPGTPVSFSSSDGNKKYCTFTVPFKSGQSAYFYNPQFQTFWLDRIVSYNTRTGLAYVNFRLYDEGANKESFNFNSGSYPIDSLLIRFRKVDESEFTQDDVDALTTVVGVGDIKTATEPYTGGNISIDFGQTVYGGVLDWISGVLTVTKEKVILNGSEVWASGPSFNGYSTAKSEKYKDAFLPLCNIAKGVISNQTTGYTIRADYGAFRFQGFAGTFQDLDSFKVFLQSQNAEIICELAEPITVQLTSQEILALTGTNTIYTNTGDATVVGRADPNATIKGLLSRIDALEKAAVGGG